MNILIILKIGLLIIASVCLVVALFKVNRKQRSWKTIKNAYSSILGFSFVILAMILSLV